jgi:hypothetical protein
VADFERWRHSSANGRFLGLSARTGLIAKVCFGSIPAV